MLWLPILIPAYVLLQIALSCAAWWLAILYALTRRAPASDGGVLRDCERWMIRKMKGGEA